MGKTYFALDGSYGDAEGMVVIDTSNWTDEQWYDIETSSDSERVDVAINLQ